MENERWSYQVVNVKPGFFGHSRNAIQEKLNQLGPRSWELVAVVQTQVFRPVQLYFKKEMS